ncbi:MAG: TetR/AcrR family transcriptional regulator [Afipia sp.]|jgi:TetR/AcrR family transcriptional repressor of nem operon|nr:TetR/AcrR family transcriptional regulator [Afipia sp.]
MTTSERLLDAAEARMRKVGYNAVSFRELADDVSIKSSSVHYHFPAKQDLGVALIERYAKRVFDMLEERSRDAKTPAEQLRAYGSVYRACLVEDGSVCLGGLLAAEMAGLPLDVQTAVRRFFEANIDWIENVLPNNHPPRVKRARAGSFVAAHQGAIMVALGLRDFAIFDGITENLITCVLSKPTTATGSKKR